MGALIVFEEYKKSDTIVIFGAGRSLTELKDKDWNHLKQFDMIGFNLFIMQKWVSPTFMIVGDIRPEKTTGFYVKSVSGAYQKYVDFLNDRYKDTLFIVRNDQLKKLPEKFKKYKYTVVSKNNNAKVYGRTGFDQMHFNKSTLFSALDWVIKMKYSNVIFAGVDLYDYRFFWLDKNDLRVPGTPEEKPSWAKRRVNKKHPIVKKTLEFLKSQKKYLSSTGIKFYSYNHKSLILTNSLIKPYEVK